MSKSTKEKTTLSSSECSEKNGDKPPHLDAASNEISATIVMKDEKEQFRRSTIADEIYTPSAPPLESHTTPGTSGAKEENEASRGNGLVEEVEPPSASSPELNVQIKAGDLSTRAVNINAEPGDLSELQGQSTTAAATSSHVGEMGVRSVAEPLESSLNSETEIGAASLPNSLGESPSSDLKLKCQGPELTPADQDVLFGRGGVTNNHVGNRRFRDIIGLHREDYVRAVKVKKPDVSKRIVQAIRTGNRPGRFLRRDSDGKWHQVSDKVAAIKTSQALREKMKSVKDLSDVAAAAAAAGNNTEGSVDPEKSGLNSFQLAASGLLQRQNAMAVTGSVFPSSPEMPYSKILSSARAPVLIGKRKRKLGPSSPADRPQKSGHHGGVPPTSVQEEIVMPPMPTPPSATGDNRRIKVEDSKAIHAVPENAILGPVDVDGRIVIHDGDVLFGRGGMTNHHPGNVRFRELVAYHRNDYLRAAKADKPIISKLLVVAMRKASPPSRFLRMNASNEWRDVGDQRAAEKVSQALRERWTPTVGEKLRSEATTARGR